MTKIASDKLAAAMNRTAMVTSYAWPYSMDVRGYPIVSCYLSRAPVWRSYVVLPNSSLLVKFDFPYWAFWRRPS